MEEAGQIYILNFSMEALRKAQGVFEGEAKRTGLQSEEDVLQMMKEFCREGLLK